MRLLEAAITREGYDDLRHLPGAFDRLQQVRNDLAHSDLRPVDLFQDPPVEYRLFSHRRRPLDVLPEIVTVEILLEEQRRAVDDVRPYMDGLAYRLGMLRLVSPEGAPPLSIPETGPGPKPVVREDN